MTALRAAGAGLAMLVSAAAALCSCGGTARTAPDLLALDATVGTVANPVAVSPLPGTDDASPASQISFLGARGTKVSDVLVVGSRSGVHSGTLRAYSTGTGESFLPRSPFLAGERVSVRARVGVGGAAQMASTTFTIAHPAAVSEQEFPPEGGDPNAVRHFRSAPALAPSTVTITTPPQRGAAPGYLFLAPYEGAGTPGPMIVDQRGGLVWFRALPSGQQATNFQVQRYRGEPVLTWWQGRILDVGFGAGEGMIYDSSYRRVAVVRAGNGYRADLHELRLTPAGTAWIDAFAPIRANLSAAHGSSEGVITDSVVQEIDVKTGLVMWEWHALGHIPASESNAPPSRGSYPWDYAHINSVDPGAGGDVLLSARSTWALYDVDIRTGAVRWRLGGKRSSFAIPAAARFYWQHDAEFRPGGLISLFDNGSSPPEEKQSRGLLLHVDGARRRVTLVKQLVNPTRTLLSESQGDLHALPRGNWLLGYGRLPNVTELDGSGRVLLDATLGPKVQDFDAFLAPWSGRPRTPPALAVARVGAGRVVLAASWNGATEVASWRVLVGSSPRTLKPVASSRKTGFETMIAVHTHARYAAVQALDAKGSIIGRSSAAAA